MKAKELEKTVLDGGFCIGCGGCAGVTGSPFDIKYDGYGMLRAERCFTDESPVSFVKVCPFGAEALSEDKLSEIFLPTLSRQHSVIGRYISCRIGHVTEDNVRMRASSGGMGRWLLSEMLRSEYVDAVVHVRQNIGEGASQNLYEYTVTRHQDELIETARSAYYPVSFNQVITYMRENPGRYAVTGVPCFVKALRLLSLEDEKLRERIIVTVGIVCGHLKSTAFAENFGWQLGVPPEDLGGIEFRGKMEDLPANHKGVAAYSLTQHSWTPFVSSKRLIGGDWGLSLFKYKACDYCDDIFAETADIVIGDAWLPDFVKDSKGSSIIVCRNPHIERMLVEGESSGSLMLVNSSPEQIVRSQAGGVRHKSEGLAYRLSVDDACNNWHPPKRVMPSSKLSKRRQRIYSGRVELAASSHKAFLAAKKADDLAVFNRMMQGMIDSYQMSQVSKTRALRRKVAKIARRLSQYIQGLIFQSSRS